MAQDANEYFTGVWKRMSDSKSPLTTREGAPISIPGQAYHLNFELDMYGAIEDTLGVFEDDANDVQMKIISSGTFPGLVRSQLLMTVGLQLGMGSGAVTYYLLEPGDGFGYVLSGDFDDEPFFRGAAAFRIGSSPHVLPMIFLYLADQSMVSGGVPFEIENHAPALIPKWTMKETVRLCDYEYFDVPPDLYDQFTGRVLDGEDPQEISDDLRSPGLDAHFDAYYEEKLVSPLTTEELADLFRSPGRDGTEDVVSD